MRRVSEKYILIGIGVITLVILGMLYVTLAGPIRKKEHIVGSQYTSKSSKLRKYLSGSEGPPSKRIIEVLEEGNKRLEKEYELVKKQLTFEQNVQMPTSGNPALFFQQRLLTVRGEMLKLSNKSGVEIPPSLGFSDAMPDGKQVPALLRQLGVMQDILKLGINSNLLSINSLTFGEISNKSYFEEVPIELTVNGNLMAITQFLYNVQNASELYVIEKISITSKEANMLSLDLLINTIVWI
ncbi:MAG: Amuc_1100 family pilus-like protein [bacterium]|nr:Amuc_1100 family pilus-like protein [bacterium]